MSKDMIIVITVLTLVAGAASYLNAYWQISHAYARPEARRRALGAVPGPMAFYALLGVSVSLAAPLLLHP